MMERKKNKKIVINLFQKIFIMLKQNPGEQIRPNVSLKDAGEMVLTLYGLKVRSIKCLNSYEDKNFFVDVSTEHSNPNLKELSSHGYTLKILNSLESQEPKFTIAQNELMEFLRKQNVACPMPIPNLSNEYYSMVELPCGSKQNKDCNQWKKHIVRMLTYIPGELLHDLDCTSDIFYEVGLHLSRLHEAMKNFCHPAFEIRKTIWSLSSVKELKSFMYALKSCEYQTLVEEVIEHFTKSVDPIFELLPKGLIHGDFNEQNILMQLVANVDGCQKTYKVCGTLDFADVQRTCYVFDIAIALAYMMMQSKNLDPKLAGGYFLAGYASNHPLNDIEWSVLKVCTATRLCQSLVLGTYNHLMDPENEYILITQKEGWNLLNEIWITEREELIQSWKMMINSIKDIH